MGITEISRRDFELRKEGLDGDTMYLIKDYPNIGFNNVTVGTDRFEDEINKIKQMLNSKVTLVHNCQNCGATLNLEENKPLFHCRYCGSTYLIGTQRLMQTY